VASLTAIFGNSRADDEDSEKLLELYWNRAELKKEFASLREETFRLEKRIEEHKGGEARIQQKLDHLESLLLDPEWVHSVVVHYQLRALNESLTRKVMRFAEQLKQQREQREHGRLLEAWQEEKDAEIEDVAARIGEQRGQLQFLEEQLQAARQRYASMGAIARFFRKRSVTRELDDIVATIEARQSEEQKLLEQLDDIENRAAPDTQGLSLSQKRSINFMILSFVQQVYLHFEEYDLANLAKEAGDKSVGAIRYGNKKECDTLMERFARRARNFDSVGDFADTLRQRAKLLSEKAVFKNDDDVLPVPTSVTTIFRIHEDRVTDESDRNLLGQNYWGVRDAVSR
jgi:hypothetical protein